MRSDAFLINTARGGIVNEQALHEALSKEKLGGAAVDVFEEEFAVVKPMLDALRGRLRWDKSE